MRTTALGPFCGCGTTIDAAQKLDRDWIGIDITQLAITLIKKRLTDTYGRNVRFVSGAGVSSSSRREEALTFFEFEPRDLGCYGVLNLDFGFRVSFGPRISDFGFRGGAW